MTSLDIKSLLTSFSPSSDFFAIASIDGRIKIWDALKGQLQTEFADIASSPDALGIPSADKRGHLALDYKCIKWVQIGKKKKKRAGGSLLVLGTGNGDVLAVDVALGQLKWKVTDCHPGGVTAISYSGHNLCIYTAGVDGMVCQIDSSNGGMIGRFKASTKAISALSVSPDGKILATAAAQLKIFNCSNNKKIQKFSGHPVSVRSMIFSDDGKYILSSAVGERYIAIWRIGDGKKQSASCVLSMEHSAIYLDSKGSDAESTESAGLYILAISEMGTCYFWYGSSIDALRDCKPTKISLSIDSTLSRTNKGLTIFAARFHGIVTPASTSMLVAYGSLIKPSFEKIVVQYGKDIHLDASEDGVLLPMGQSYTSNKRQVTRTQVTALDRSNAEDAMLPLPKLFDHEKKRKHVVPRMIADMRKEVNSADADGNKAWSALTEVYQPKMEEGDTPCVEDRLRAAGILGDKDNLTVESYPRDPASTAIFAPLCDGSNFPVDVNLPTKKVRSSILTMSPSDAYKLMETLVSSWKARSATSEHVLPWMYYILVIHGQYIISQESSKQLLDGLQKMTNSKCAAIQPLLKLSGCLQLIMTQIDKAGRHMVQAPSHEHHLDQIEGEGEDEDEDADVDELIYGEEEDESQSGSDGDN